MILDRRSRRASFKSSRNSKRVDDGYEPEGSGERRVNAGEEAAFRSGGGGEGTLGSSTASVSPDVVEVVVEVVEMVEVVMF